MWLRREAPEPHTVILKERRRRDGCLITLTGTSQQRADKFNLIISVLVAQKILNGPERLIAHLLQSIDNSLVVARLNKVPDINCLTCFDKFGQVAYNRTRFEVTFLCYLFNT